jgi:hypothetical protein
VLGKPVYDFIFIVVEKQPPHGIAIFRLDDHAVSVGQDETIDDLRKLKVSIETNAWPNIPNEVTELTLPKWYANK